jgi:hypothetical protein
LEYEIWKKNFWKKFGKFGGMYYLCSMNIKYEISKEQVKTIFGNLPNQNMFLWFMKDRWNIPVKLNRKGEEVLDISKIGDVTDYIVNNWEYESCRDIIRNMFMLEDKYQSGEQCKTVFKETVEEYRNDGHIDFNFPFVSNNFDSHVMGTVVHPSIKNPKLRKSLTDKLCDEVRKFVDLKFLNTLRNNYIEYLIFNSSIDVIPTFGQKKGIDFYINGEGFDQKVSRSVTNQFKKEYGDDWRDVAIENPYEVCRYLMMYGDESRFSNVPRLFVVDIDGKYELDGIEGIVQDINFDTPRVVDYVYDHKSTGERSYSCPVICILLTNLT